MKTISILCCVLTTQILSAQIDHCIENRYAQTPLFDSMDVLTNTYTYSIEPRWPSSTMDTLTMDIHEPAPLIDPLEKRPFILMVHGGSFIGGSRSDMSYSAHEMARRGFVTGTIDYRLGWDCTNNPPDCFVCGSQAAKLRIAEYRAVQDARAALRYIVQNADVLGIDTAQIFVQGTSAGAITVLQTAFWDQSEANAFCPSCYTTLGSLNSSGLAAPVNFSIKGVINNCGSINTTEVMEGANIPVVGFHDEWDVVVPYAGGRLLNFIVCEAFHYVSGSNLIRMELDSNGVCYGLNTKIASAGHCSYESGALVQKAACFLKSILCNTCTSYLTNNIWDVPDCTPGTASLEALNSAEGVNCYPNPTSGTLHVKSEARMIQEVKVIAMDGRILSIYAGSAQELTLTLSALQKGQYMLKILMEGDFVECKAIRIE
jgi:hypothetical protein